VRLGVLLVIHVGRECPFVVEPAAPLHQFTAELGVLLAGVRRGESMTRLHPGGLCLHFMGRQQSPRPYITSRRRDPGALRGGRVSQNRTCARHQLAGGLACRYVGKYRFENLARQRDRPGSKMRQLRRLRCSREWIIVVDAIRQILNGCLESLPVDAGLPVRFE
jgi:hypothetical protein